MATTKPKTKSKVSKQTIYFTVFALAWALLATAASQFVVAYPMFWLLGEKFSTPLWTCIYYALSYALTLALIIFIPPRLVRLLQQRRQQPVTDTKNNPLATNITELGVQHLPTFTDIGLAPIGYVVYLFGANLITRLMLLFPWFQADQTQNTGFGYFLTTVDRLLAILALVIIAPVAEELVMRGWLYGKLRSRLKAPITILLVSILFALLHGQWNVAVDVFALSVVLCSLREITGTVWSGMLLHILKNGIAFYLLYITGF